MADSILIIDDDVPFCCTLGKLLLLEGYKIFKAFDIKTGMDILKKESIDAILLDVILPDGNGAIVANSIRQTYPKIRVINISGYPDISNYLPVNKNGLVDFITKASDAINFVELIQNQLLSAKMHYPKENITATPFGFHNIIGESKEIKEAIQLALKVAASDASVLFLGETGTGKELFARAVHNSSARSTKAFVAFNCSAFSDDLLESELFGYKSGAFTGAVKDKTGLLELADQGTIFLDEIGDMGKNIQAKLLRVLETGEFIKLGDTVVKKVDTRLISATNKDLEEEVKRGNFREDLFYRINLFTIHLPPLRARNGDIILLANYFAGLFAQKLSKHYTAMTKEFEGYLKDYPWGGNIRELKNIIERAVILMEGAVLTEEYLPYEILSFQLANSMHNDSIYALEIFERFHIQKVLVYTNWDKPQAARLLNISISTLYRKIDDFMLRPNNQKLN